MRLVALLAGVLLCSPCLRAAVGSIQPPNPTSVDVIVIDVSTPYAELRLQPVVINGSQIEITFRGYPTVPAGGGALVSVGPLPAGVYTIIVRHVIEDQQGNPAFTLTDPTVTLTVANAAFVPALDSSALAAMAACLAAAALLALRRV